MTWWPADRIAAFASSVGWRGDELVTATAVALAASEGRDHVVISVPPPPMVEYVGLWLVPAGEVSGFEVVELLDPSVNARAARVLYLREGGGWSWSPTYAVGRWQWKMDDARRAIERPRLLSPPSPIAALGEILRASSQLHMDALNSKER